MPERSLKSGASHCCGRSLAGISWQENSTNHASGQGAPTCCFRLRPVSGLRTPVATHDQWLVRKLSINHVH
eukprot:975623-Pyramimonas_sp.AAC.2